MQENGESNFDFLSFSLGTLGICFISNFLKELHIPYADVIACLIGNALYLYMR